MPCRYATTLEDEARAHEAAKKMRDDLDRLTSENDQLRELVTAAVHQGMLTPGSDLLPNKAWRKITKNQVAHRQEDLDRLRSTLTETLSHMINSEDMSYWTFNGQRYNKLLLRQMLGAVVTADTAHPLESQLGFDPDSI